MKRITVAVDSFKGSLSSREVADAFEKGFKRVFSRCEVRKVSIADGGVFVFYPTLAVLFGRVGYFDFIRRVYPLQLFAFTTSSSAATLPMTYTTAQERLGVSRETASFVLPIGTTINMDGTSCYQTVATLFIAQALGCNFYRFFFRFLFHDSFLFR